MPFGVEPVVLPGAGGLGASMMPEVEGVVDGVGTASRGTECVVGIVEAVGEVLVALPLTSLAGCGMLGGSDGFGVWGGAVGCDACCGAWLEVPEPALRLGVALGVSLGLS